MPLSRFIAVLIRKFPAMPIIRIEHCRRFGNQFIELEAMFAGQLLYLMRR